MIIHLVSTQNFLGNFWVFLGIFGKFYAHIKSMFPNQEWKNMQS